MSIFNLAPPMICLKQSSLAPSSATIPILGTNSYQAFIACCAATILFMQNPSSKIIFGATSGLCFIALIASTGRAAIASYLIFIFLSVLLNNGAKKSIENSNC